MQHTESHFSRMTVHQMRAPLVLCVLCQVLLGAFSQDASTSTTREMLVGGVCAAVAMMFLLWCLVSIGQTLSFSTQKVGSVRCKQVIYAVMWVLLFGGVVQAVLQQVQWYDRHFQTGHLWVLLFAVLACGLHATPHALMRCARLLLFLCVVCAVVAILGLLTQSDWHNLSRDPLTTQGISSGFWAGFGLYPEYLAFLLCPMDGKVNARNKERETNDLSMLILPFFAVLVQVGVVFCSELMFGTAVRSVGGFEFLRSWALLDFSRFDPVMVLLWSLIALFRLRFLVALLGQAYQDGKQSHGDVRTGE